jgi:hypothetical protein
MKRWRLFYLIVIVILGLCAFSLPFHASTPTVTTCDAANPFDNLPDDVALQSCLDNYDRVLLKPDYLPGYVGYLLSAQIRLKRNGALLTTADNPHKVTIRAVPAAANTMLRAPAIDNFEISFIRFDGNRENRDVRNRACGNAVNNFGNVDLTGIGFHVRYAESFGAVCGSAMVVRDSRAFEISNSLFYDNGRQPEDANNISGLWSDGLTVYDCQDSTIRDNVLWDNTDVDLGVNGGAGCGVYRNTISHFRKYAFAGLVIGDPSASGGEFSDNTVSSGDNLLGFGILVGCHPWSQCGGGYASNVAVHNNSSIGAVVNLAVDGLNGGSVWNNSVKGARGSRVLDCPGKSFDYTVGHAINVAPLQHGYTIRIFDPGSTCQ